MKIINILVLLSLIFGLSGCIGLNPVSVAQTAVEKKVNKNQKTFEEEDAYILFALRAEQIGEYNASASIFNTLYEKSDKKEYLYRSLQNDLSAKNNQKIIDKVDAQIQNPLDDLYLARIKVVALVQLQRLAKAETLALALAQKSQTIQDHILVADIYIKDRKFNEAVTYLDNIYKKDFDEQVIDKISLIIFANLQKPEEAIKRLQTHSGIHGCSELICARLVNYYAALNKIDPLLETYLRLYSLEKNEKIGQKIVQIYIYKKDTLNLINFLESAHIDDNTLIELYVSAKNYEKAYHLSDALYLSSGEIHYLGQSAVYEYESYIKKDDPLMLKSVMSKFEEVLSQNSDTLYLNYYGYLLIDHKLNIKKGIEYVEKALKVHPNSAYYLDSLAWGYYRLGNCKKARVIINRVLTLEGGDDEEVLLHKKAIYECNNKRKR